jgi:hypothetical protein
MRYRQDIMRDISVLTARMASNRKTADNTASSKTAGICDAVYPSMERQLGELYAELFTAKERPVRDTGFQLPDGATPAPQNIMSREGPLNEWELEELEIPAFLRR